MVYFWIIFVSTLPPSHVLLQLCLGIVNPADIFRILASNPGKSKVTLSLNSVTQQLQQSSTVAISKENVRRVVEAVCECVPWFCEIVLLGGDCQSSPSTPGVAAKAGNQVIGKENDSAKPGLGEGIQGLLIFGKRNGRLIGREEVIAQFRMKRDEYERQTKV